MGSRGRLLSSFPYSGRIKATSTLRKLDRITIRIEGCHGALPWLIVRRLMEYYASRLEIFVKPVEIIGAELDMD